MGVASGGRIVSKRRGFGAFILLTIFIFVYYNEYENISISDGGLWVPITMIGMVEDPAIARVGDMQNHFLCLIYPSFTYGYPLPTF